MRTMITSVVVSVLLGGFTVAAAQLPPEIMADFYLLQAERFLAEEDYGAALDAMNEVVVLQSEHNLDLPDEFHFKYARVALSAGLNKAAIDSVNKYLVAAGREGEFYREALELLDKAQAEIEELKEQRERMAREAQEAAREQEAREARAREVQKIRAALERDISTAMEFVRIPAGESRMGSTSEEARDNEQPVTQVRISRGFWLGKYEVTQGQWEAVMGSNTSGFQECGLDCPVENVSWEDAQEFIGRLNAMDGAGTYRLPTEAEWEYAARAGTTGDRYGNLDAIAWYRDNSGRRTHPVGGKAANAFGLNDMLGNVWEWVGDWYGGLPGGTVTDPRGPGSGSLRVFRGGGGYDSGSYCRSSIRCYGVPPGYHRADLGFRLLRTE